MRRAKRPIIVIDAETDPFRRGRVPQPFLWGVYDGTEYRQFTDTRAMVEYLAEQPALVFAHNGGKFDFHFLLDYLTAYDPVLVIHGRLVRFKIGLAEFRDSYAILPFPLRDYKKDDFDYTLMEKGKRERAANRVKIENYLRHDCLYLHELVSAFIAEFGPRITAASASMAAWRKSTGVKIPRSGLAFYSYFHPWYFGGRVECFQKGVLKGPVTLNDINSAYPRAMLESHAWGTEYRLARNREIIPQGFYIVRAQANGCFPLLNEASHSLDFPVSNSLTNYHVTGWELIAAIETGSVKCLEVLRGHIFDQCIDFADYVRPLYQAKSEAKSRGDSKTELFNKLKMNSLYGKFGANPSNYLERFLSPAADTPTMGDKFRVEGYSANGKWALVSDLKRPVRSPFFNIATAASITGCQRARLFRELKKVRFPLYSDTDSIVSQGTHEEALDSGTDLGQWSRVGSWCEAAIGGKKLYALRGGLDGEADKVASKGARLTPEQVFRVARGESIVYEFEEPTFSLKKPVDFLSRTISMT